MNRRQFVKRGMLGVAALAAVEGLVREPRHPIGEEVEVRLRRLPEAFDGFRLAQISDIHFGPFMGKSGVERGVAVAKSMRPDFVVLTGDLVSHSLGKTHGADGAHHAEPCADVLAQWKNTPMLAILGNHDHWNEQILWRARCGSEGFASCEMKRWRSSVAARGCGWRAWMMRWCRRRTCRRRWAAFRRRRRRCFWRTAGLRGLCGDVPVDLQLSGHSHGGQVRLPGIGPIVLPEMAKKYHTGLNRVGAMQVYTNWGLGMITPPVRFLCPPKVTVLTLRKG